VSVADRPILKEPTWTPEIPTYFYVGGLAGASAALGWVSGIAGEDDAARRAWLVAFGGSLASPALLISDLGRPARFLNMLRMFKITSPMSVGSWVLAAFGTATAPAALHAVVGIGRAGRIAQAGSALLGLPLAAYTAALIGNTAIPVWHHARIQLPFIFVAGAAASAGAMGAMLSPVEQAGAARRLALAGAAAELALTQAMERRLDGDGVGTPYHEGPAGYLGTAAKALTGAGALALAARGGRSRRWALAGGALVTAGALAERWSIFRAGFQSAARPQDVVVPQRRALRDGAGA
jgi:hypothetical protein